jgi:hypothetical protein
LQRLWRRLWRLRLRLSVLGSLPPLLSRPRSDCVNSSLLAGFDMVDPANPCFLCVRAAHAR